jgi:hypothetical protein
VENTDGVQDQKYGLQKGPQCEGHGSQKTKTEKHKRLRFLFKIETVVTKIEAVVTKIEAAVNETSIKDQHCNYPRD